jgi:hypothetical protein
VERHDTQGIDHRIIERRVALAVLAVVGRRVNRDLGQSGGVFAKSIFEVRAIHGFNLTSDKQS